MDVPKAVYHLETSIDEPCAVIKVQENTELNDGDFVAIASLTSIERFVASSIIANKYIYRNIYDNKNVCLQNKYPINTEIISFERVIYYLAKSNYNNLLYTLYRDTINKNADGVVDGVEDFYINLINSNNIVIGVDVGGLLRSDNAFFGKQEFLWRGKLYTFTYKYFRKPLIITVALRNVC